jgi:hypothetical protein
MTAMNSSREGSPSDAGEAFETEPEAQGGLEGLMGVIARRPEQLHALHELLRPYCHEGRNLLNSVKMSLYLGRRNLEDVPDDGWGEIQSRYGEVESLFDRLQLICRPMALACVRLPLALLLEDRRGRWERELAGRGMMLEFVAPPGKDVAEYDPNYLGQALDSFVAWRAATGREGRSARLSWGTVEGRSRIEWIESDDATSPCKRRGGNAQGRDHAGPCGALALPLLSQVVSAHGGELEQVRPGGQHVRLAWPQVVRPAPRSCP